MNWANAIATKLSAALPVRMVELNNCFARAYVQAMAVCAEGRPCSAVVVRRTPSFAVEHPSGWYACAGAANAALKEEICHSVRWDWHVATGVSPTAVDEIIDAGLRPQQPLMREEQWLATLGIARDPYLKRFEVPGSLAMALSRTLGQAVGPELEPWLGRPRIGSIGNMPRFSQFDISGAKLILNCDFDRWETTYGDRDGCCTDRRALFERYLDEWTSALREYGLLG